MIPVKRNSQDRKNIKKKICGHKAGTWHVEYGRVILTCRNCGKESSLKKRWHTIPQEYDRDWHTPGCGIEIPVKNNEIISDRDYRFRCNKPRHHTGKHKNDRGETW